MKKLLYTLLAVSIIFSACKKEEEEPTNNTNNNNSGNNTNLAIGDSHQGGIIFYLDGNGEGLVAAPTDQSSDAEWGCHDFSILGAGGTAVGTGYQNTVEIELRCSESDIAAKLCTNLTIGGYSDWFLPSKDELELIYLNLHIQGFSYFSPDFYWSSTELDSKNAIHLYFVDGNFDGNYKTNPFSVRAVRAF
jgi:hypothetical protein